jgi:hypothetical protein
MGCLRQMIHIHPPDLHTEVLHLSHQSITKHLVRRVSISYSPALLLGLGNTKETVREHNCGG